MFCKNCGTLINENEHFCGKCGQQTSCGNKGFKVDKKVIAIALILIAAIVIGAIVVSFGKNSNKRDIEDVAKAIVDAEFGCTDISVIEEYAEVLPENYLDYLVEEGEGWLWDDKEEWIEVQFDEYSEDSEEYQDKYGDDYTYSFKITKEKDYNTDELLDYSEECSEFDIKPQAAKDVTIKVRVGGNGYGKDYRLEVTMIKLDGSWYLMKV